MLIVGGDSDPNIMHMVERCSELGIDFTSVLMGKKTPSVTIDIAANSLIVDGVQCRPKSVFIRPNVFEYLETKDRAAYTRATDWFALFIGWMLANPGVRFFNRRYYHRNGVNKIETLLLASSLGFFVPETYLTNDLSLINEKAGEGRWIEKPVEGGEHTKILEARDPKDYAGSVLIAPTTVQQKLIFPEIRVFRAGNLLKGFMVDSDKLDYRDSKNTTLKPVEVPEGFYEPFMALTERMGLEYAAADLKTDEATGKLALLEVNSGPMFVGFDKSSNGDLTKAMIEYLVPSK